MLLLTSLYFRTSFSCSWLSGFKGSTRACFSTRRKRCDVSSSRSAPYFLPWPARAFCCEARRRILAPFFLLPGPAERPWFFWRVSSSVSDSPITVGGGFQPSCSVLVLLPNESYAVSGTANQVSELPLFFLMKKCSP